MIDPVNDVRFFNAKFKLPDGSGPPRLLTEEEHDFRVKFMREELDEFIEAHARGDIANCLDALVDLVYVAVGTALFMSVPFEAGWREVQRANMEKIRALNAEASKRGSALDVIKPEGWRAPDHRPALAATTVGRQHNVAAVRIFFDLSSEQAAALLNEVGVHVEPFDHLAGLLACRDARKIDALIARLYRVETSVA